MSGRRKAVFVLAVEGNVERAMELMRLVVQKLDDEGIPWQMTRRDVDEAALAADTAFARTSLRWVIAFCVAFGGAIVSALIWAAFR